MKTIITLLFVAITSTAFSSKYEEAMKTNIDKLYELTTAAELQTLANQFERIARAETNKWLPDYYAAYCFVRSTLFNELDAEAKNDQLNKAQQIVEKLMKSHDSESEVHALQAFIYQLRITDIASGAKYSRKAASSIAAAERLNPENPRVYYLRGSNTFHTPNFFGGGAENAKPDLEKAASIFEAKKHEESLMPTWGWYHNQQLLDQCNAAEEQ